MTLGIRRVSLTDDRAEILDILNRNFGAGQERRFDWLYIDNPAGEAWAWLAWDHDKTVGTAAVFPRRMLVDGKLVLCGQVGGFAVDASHRSLGPAVLLQRATFGPVDSGALTFCYDCPPNDRGMATFDRLGMRPNCEIARYALPLRSDAFLEKRLGKSIWVKPVVATANLLLDIRTRSRISQGLEIDALPGGFGDEFSELDRRVSSSGTIRASRSADLLNWRFRKNATADPQVFVARRAGELLGFVAFWSSGEAAYVIDLFGVELDTVGVALLETAVEACKREEVCSLNGFCSEDSWLKALFESSGFRSRERGAKVVAYEKSTVHFPKVLHHGLRWTFGHLEEAVSEQTDFIAVAR